MCAAHVGGIHASFHSQSATKALRLQPLLEVTSLVAKQLGPRALAMFEEELLFHDDMTPAEAAGPHVAWLLGMARYVCFVLVIEVSEIFPRSEDDFGQENEAPASHKFLQTLLRRLHTVHKPIKTIELVMEYIKTKPEGIFLTPGYAC